MPKDQVFLCLEAISNRYAREASVYKQNSNSADGTVDMDDPNNSADRLRAMGINVVNSP